MFNMNQSKATTSSTQFSAILNLHVPLCSLLTWLTISHKLNTFACYLFGLCMHEQRKCSTAVHTNLWTFNTACPTSRNKKNIQWEHTATGSYTFLIAASLYLSQTLQKDLQVTKKHSTQFAVQFTVHSTNIIQYTSLIMGYDNNINSHISDAIKFLIYSPL